MAGKETWPIRHGELWYNTDDKKHRAYDKKISKWCTYDETEDPILRQILGNMNRINKCQTHFSMK